MFRSFHLGDSRLRTPEVSEVVNELPTTGAVAEYRGARYRIVFGSSGWFALGSDMMAAFGVDFCRAPRWPNSAA